MIDRLDHPVLTVSDLGRSIDFYCRGLGMRDEVFGAGSHALVFGRQKLNLHEAQGEPILPRAAVPALDAGARPSLAAAAMNSSLLRKVLLRPMRSI